MKIIIFSSITVLIVGMLWTQSFTKQPVINTQITHKATQNALRYVTPWDFARQSWTYEITQVTDSIYKIHHYLVDKKVNILVDSLCKMDSVQSLSQLWEIRNSTYQYYNSIIISWHSIPFGMPCNGYLSSSFGLRKDPIPHRLDSSNAKIKISTIVKNKSQKSKAQDNHAIDTPHKAPIKITYKEVKGPMPAILKTNEPTPPKKVDTLPTRKPKLLASSSTTEVPNSETSNLNAAKQVKLNKTGTSKKEKSVTKSNRTLPEGMQFHKGLDFGLAWGSPVRTTADGIVEFAGIRSGYGKCVIVMHAYGYSTLYGHLSSIAVRTGQKIALGETLALSGNTGRSTGPHLHYEVHRYGIPIDPKAFLSL